jgi:hypothetical protein
MPAHGDAKRTRTEEWHGSLALPHDGLPTNFVPPPPYCGIDSSSGYQASTPESSDPDNKVGLGRNVRPATRYGGTYTPNTKDRSRSAKVDDNDVTNKIKKEVVDHPDESKLCSHLEPTDKPKKSKKSGDDKVKGEVKDEKDELDEHTKRQLARAKNRVHAKESRARKKLWLDELRDSVDRLKETLEAKEQQIHEMAHEMERCRMEKMEFMQDQAALQSLFQTAGKSSVTIAGMLQGRGWGERVGIVRERGGDMTS